MPQLASSTTENKHSHLVYLNDQVGQGMSSLKKGHTHNVAFNVELEQWVMEPSEDGHTHQVVPYVPKLTKPKKLTKKDKVDSVLALYKAELQCEHDARKDAKESRGFYTGKSQWADKTKQTLNREKRASITINEVAAKVDLLAGFQRQNRTDTKFAPIEEGDQSVAKLLDVVYKNIEDQNGFGHEESLAFLDELIEGRGNFHVYVDFDEDVQGKIVIEHLSNKEVVYGPHERFDLKDCEHMSKFKMFSKAKIEQNFPEVADDINAMFNHADLTALDDPIIDNPGDQYATGVQMDLGAGFGSETLVDIEKKQIKVIENYQREYYTEYALVVPEDGFAESIPNLSKSEAFEWETIPVIRSVRRNRSSIKRIVVAGTVFIEESESDDFDIIPVYAKKDGNYFYGKVEEVKDPQREINKRHSQAIDILNKQATYNWIIDDDVFKDARSEKEFIANSSTPGYVIKVNSMRNLPEKVEGSKIPSEVVGMMELSSNKLREIMNIPAEALGFSEREFSGIALQEKKHSTQMANEFLFDNLNAAKRLLAKRVMMKVQEHYDVDRIVRLVNNSRPQSDSDVQKNQINVSEAQLLLENEDLMKYDVVTTPSISSPTARTANFAILFELAKQGVIQDPSIIIGASDIPNKQEILGNLEAAAQASQQAEAQKQQTELLKSLPDELQAQQLGAQLPQQEGAGQ
jgi:hypothetical protein